MAYLKPITERCATCGKVATEQLINFVNAPLGYYCGRCGKKALAKQDANEERHVLHARAGAPSSTAAEIMP